MQYYKCTAQCLQLLDSFSVLQYLLLHLVIYAFHYLQQLLTILSAMINFIDPLHVVPLFFSHLKHENLK